MLWLCCLKDLLDTESDRELHIHSRHVEQSPRASASFSQAPNMKAWIAIVLRCRSCLSI